MKMLLLDHLYKRKLWIVIVITAVLGPATAWSGGPFGEPTLSNEYDGHVLGVGIDQDPNDPRRAGCTVRMATDLPGTVAWESGLARRFEMTVPAGEMNSALMCRILAKAVQTQKRVRLTSTDLNAGQGTISSFSVFSDDYDPQVSAQLPDFEGAYSFQDAQIMSLRIADNEYGCSSHAHVIGAERERVNVCGGRRTIASGDRAGEPMESNEFNTCSLLMLALVEKAPIKLLLSGEGATPCAGMAFGHAPVEFAEYSRVDEATLAGLDDARIVSPSQSEYRGYVVSYNTPRTSEPQCNIKLTTEAVGSRDFESKGVLLSVGSVSGDNTEAVCSLLEKAYGNQFPITAVVGNFQEQQKADGSTFYYTQIQSVSLDNQLDWNRYDRLEVVDSNSGYLCALEAGPDSIHCQARFATLLDLSDVNTKAYQGCAGVSAEKTGLYCGTLATFLGSSIPIWKESQGTCPNHVGQNLTKVGLETLNSGQMTQFSNLPPAP